MESKTPITGALFQPKFLSDGDALALFQAAQKLEADRAALIAALEFYAAEGNWKMQRQKFLTGGGTYLTGSEISRDDGDKARDALAKVQS